MRKEEEEEKIKIHSQVRKELKGEVQETLIFKPRHRKQGLFFISRDQVVMASRFMR